MQTTGLRGSRLSIQQTHLWELQKHEQTYWVQCVVSLTGELQSELLRLACEDVVDRHEILRTIFHCLPGMDTPVQMVNAESALAFDESNLQHLDALSQQQSIEERLAALRTGKSDLSQDPVVHVSLLKCAEQQAFLLLSLPALCADIPTLERFLAEMMACYVARIQQQPITLEDDVLQYVDVSEWQNEILEEEDAHLRQTFWAQADLSRMTSLRLPFGPLPATTSEEFVPQRLAVQLPASLSEEILRYAEHSAISPEAFLLSCWQLLLWRLTGKEGIPVGVACTGRHYEDLEYALGLYTRVVPLVPDFEAENTFLQSLIQVQNRLEQAKDAQMYFHWDYLRGVQGKVLTGKFFPLSFEFVPWSVELSGGELYVALTQCFGYTERFLLKFSAQQFEGVLRWEWQYDATYMQSEQVQRIADSFLVLLQSGLSQPQITIDHLPLLNQSEQERLLQAYRGPERHYSAQTFQELFEQQAEKYTGSLAVVCGEKSLTYEELNAQANRLAAWLKRHGVARDVLVCLCFERSVEMLVGLLAVLKAGGAYVPLDPDLPASRLAFQFGDTSAPVLLTQEHLLERLPAFGGQIVCLDRDTDLWADEEAINPVSIGHGEYLAYIIYTSGSTGVPKGVQIRQRSIVNYTCDVRERIAPVSGLHFATVSTLAADLGNTTIFSSLASGGCLHILSYETLASGEAFADYLERYPVDVLKIVPSHLQALLASSGERDIFPRRYLVLGGETLLTSLLQTLRRRGARCAIINHYGPTETTIGALVNELGILSEGLPPGTDDEGSLPIGSPLSNTQVCLVDQNQKIVPVGVVGELLIGGAGVAAGYLRQPELTRERFLPHPYFPELTVYRTGDLARYTDDGKVAFVGRVDRQVKLRGYRIELGEVEASLRHSPQIHEAVVMLHEDGAAEKRLVAYVVNAPDTTLRVDEVRSFLQKNLPEYMVPAVIVSLATLPLTANGKLDYHALPTPEQHMRSSQVAYVAARSPIEEVLVKIWQDVLQSPEQIGIYDNFFALGGHSLLVTQVISRLKSTLQVTLPIISLFENATIAGLAERVEAEVRPDSRQLIPLLTPVGRAQDLPLSFSQQRLWFLAQLEPLNSAYNQPFALRIQGSLSLEALEYGLGEVMRRHEILRTTFTVSAEQPLQHINPWHEYHLECRSLQNLALPQREQEMHRLMQEEARYLFDLSQGPLVRTLLLTLDEHDYVLLLTMHHIVSDGWANGLLLSELCAFYTAYSTKKSAEISDLPVQYADYAVWQRQWFQGELMEEQLDYWTRQLSGISPLMLPVDYARPAVQSFNGAEIRFQIASDLVEQLKQVSQTEGTTLFMTLLTAFQVLLARYSGQDDIAVGTPIANRHYPGLENLMGPFINTLVLRADLSGNATLREVLQQVRAVALEAYTHQDMPFERLVEVLRPERDFSRSPLFQVMFILQNMPIPEVSLEGLTLVPYERENTTSKFDLTLTVVESVQGLQCAVEYATDLFQRESIEQLLGHWQRVLQVLVEQRDLPWRSFSLLSRQQREELVETWNETAITFPDLDLVPQQIVRQASRTPGQLAVRDGREGLSYEDLARRSCQVAHLLQQAGVGVGDLVGVCLPRSVDLVVGLLGIWRVGAGYVPLDPDYPQERLALMQEQSGARFVLTAGAVAEQRSWAQGVRQVRVEEAWQQEVQEEQWYGMQAVVEAQGVAYVIYTSGSTGRPKGVAISQGALRNSLGSLQQVLGLGAQERVLAVTSLSFDIAGLELWQPLLGGGQVYVGSREQARDGEALQQALEESEATVMQGTPLSWRLLVQAGWQGRAGMWMLCGGEALPEALAGALVGKGKGLWNLYGPTETTIWSVAERIEEGGKRVRIGRPIGNTRVYVLDEQGEVVPVGVVGELWIGGASVGMGYWGAGGKTGERFVPEGYGREEGSRRYGTGDEVRWVRDGEGGGKLEYMGRKDGQVKVRGYRIELGEIEGELERQEEVEQGVVRVEGEGEEKRLVGYVVRKGGREIGERELKRRLGQRLPGYLVPERLVWVEQMPLTLNGKVDRRALSMLSQGMNKTGDEQETLAKLPGPVESILIGIWEDVLKRKGIHVQDNFFELGGHSLLATQVVTRLRRIFTPAISILTLFEAPVIAQLAQRIEQDLGAGRAALDLPALVPVSREQPLLLSFAQQRLWFQDRLDPGNAAYNIALAIRIQGTLKADILERALHEITRRHEILRTTYCYQGEQVWQNISSEDTFSLRQLDLRTEDGVQDQDRVNRLIHEEAEHPFDLVVGPLFRATLLHLNDEQTHILLVTMHHIVTDAWSLQIFRHELATLYTAFEHEQPSPLPALPIQYADFAQWQRQWFQAHALEVQLDYWTKQLRGARALDLPVDHPRQSKPGNQGASYTFRLPEDLSQALLVYSQRAEVTLFMTLLTAFQVLLSRLTGEQDIVVGTDIANRVHVETEGLIGFFVNLLALRIQLEGYPLFRDVLRQVRAMVLDAYIHQDLPFDYLVEQLQLERSGALTPLIHVLFVMQNVPEVQTMAQASELTVSPIGDIAAQQAKFDVAFFMMEGPEGLQGRVNYNADLFEEATIALLVQRYEALLQSIIAHSDYPIHVLEIATASERADLATRHKSQRSKLKATKERGINLQ
jgi:amino acid adenylation domain-containing protein